MAAHLGKEMVEKGRAAWWRRCLALGFFRQWTKLYLDLQCFRIQEAGLCVAG